MNLIIYIIMLRTITRHEKVGCCITEITHRICTEYSYLALFLKPTVKNESVLDDDDSVKCKY